MMLRQLLITTRPALVLCRSTAQATSVPTACASSARALTSLSAVHVQGPASGRKLLTWVPERSFVKSMEDRKEEKDAQAFREDIEYFLSKEEFNMFDFHERVLVSDTDTHACIRAPCCPVAIADC